MRSDILLLLARRDAGRIIFVQHPQNCSRSVQASITSAKGCINARDKRVLPADQMPQNRAVKRRFGWEMFVKEGRRNTRCGRDLFCGRSIQAMIGKSNGRSTDYRFTTLRVR